MCAIAPVPVSMPGPSRRRRMTTRTARDVPESQNTYDAILFDMDQSIQSLAGSLGQRHEDVIRLTGAYHNLVRRWADS